MSSYDPEIDPSIRLEEEERLRVLQEEQEREAARLELERTINAILDRREARERENASQTRRSIGRRERFSDTSRRLEEDSAAKSATSEPSEEKGAEPSRKRKSKKGSPAKSVFSGGFLDTPWMREHYPYLLGVIVLLLFYLMSSFSVQRLHHTRQVLERKLYTTRTDAVNMSRKAKSVSGRSAVVKRVKEMGLNIEESLEPVKVIEK
ncbi:MAG: hypothetical protein J6R87_04500 [Rikenellaceae bacterium]|nr:hypothetical protein [Rikenellaceae bacterium]